jgi:hypothetical protein
MRLRHDHSDVAIQQSHKWIARHHQIDVVIQNRRKPFSPVETVQSDVPGDVHSNHKTANDTRQTKHVQRILGFH